MQRLVNASRWDADGVRDDLLAYVREHLAYPAAILVVDGERRTSPIPLTGWYIMPSHACPAHYEQAECR
jgi:hypothetical protein